MLINYKSIIFPIEYNRILFKKIHFTTFEQSYIQLGFISYVAVIYNVTMSYDILSVFSTNMNKIRLILSMC